MQTNALAQLASLNPTDTFAQIEGAASADIALLADDLRPVSTAYSKSIAVK